MSNLLIAFLLAAGFGTWIYSKVYRQTGGNQQNSLIVGGVSGAITLLVAWTLLNMILS